MYENLIENKDLESKMKDVKSICFNRNIDINCCDEKSEKILKESDNNIEINCLCNARAFCVYMDYPKSYLGIVDKSGNLYKVTNNTNRHAYEFGRAEEHELKNLIQIDKINIMCIENENENEKTTTFEFIVDKFCFLIRLIKKRYSTELTVEYNTIDIVEWNKKAKQRYKEIRDESDNFIKDLNDAVYNKISHDLNLENAIKCFRNFKKDYEMLDSDFKIFINFICINFIDEDGISQCFIKKFPKENNKIEFLHNYINEILDNVYGKITRIIFDFKAKFKDYSIITSVHSERKTSNYKRINVAKLYKGNTNTLMSYHEEDLNMFCCYYDDDEDGLDELD